MILFLGSQDYQQAHKAGWLQAKKAMASSKSGANFGHYKTGAAHAAINEMHTLLAKIPLQSGFSYQRWKKGINIMLEKMKGNFGIEKLRIILLFEADFNQLNKFISKEVMQQAEKTRLVAGKQYGSRNGKVPVHRA